MDQKTSHIDLPPFMIPGWKAQIGTHTFTAEEIIKFASAYDPQPFHMDEEAAKSTLFGALCASGWHTVSMWMRKQRDYMAAETAERSKAGLANVEFGPSPGFENLKWLRPVFVGDTIHYFNTTLDCRKSKSKPGWHILSGSHSAENQDEKPVLIFESSVFIKYPA